MYGYKPQLIIMLHKIHAVASLDSHGHSNWQERSSNLDHVTGGGCLALNLLMSVKQALLDHCMNHSISLISDQ